MIHLFRPFLKVNLEQSDLNPRDVCAEQASEVAELLAQYRKVYGLRRVPLLMTHCVLASCIIHLIHLPKATNSHDLVQGFAALKEMSSNHALADRYPKIIIALARQWNIHLPDELTQYDLPPVNANSSQRYLVYSPPCSSNNSQHQDYIVGNSIVNESPFAKDSPRTLDRPQENKKLPLHAPEPHVPRPMEINSLMDWHLNNAGFAIADFGDDYLGPLKWDHNGQVNINPHAQPNSFANSQGTI